jgi:hypothetical protein
MCERTMSDRCYNERTRTEDGGRVRLSVRAIYSRCLPHRNLGARKDLPSF